MTYRCWLLICFLLCGCQDKGPKQVSNAIEKGDLETVLSLLDERPELLDEPYITVRNQGSPGGVSSTNVSSSVMSRPLYQAVDLRKTEIAKALLDRGALVDGRGYNDKTPLMAAAHRGGDDGAMLLLLIELGADPDALSGSGDALIHFAASKACCDTKPLEILLEMDIDIDDGGESGWTALHGAAKGGFVEGAALLCGAGADVNKKNFDGDRPVDVARKDERPEIAHWFEHADGCDLAAKIAPLFRDLERRNKTLVAWGECLFGRAKECATAGVGLGSKEHGALDRPLAQRLFERGCAQDHALSCSNTGLAIEQGWDGPRDSVAAMVFYSKACELGREKSCAKVAE